MTIVGRSNDEVVPSKAALNDAVGSGNKLHYAWIIAAVTFAVLMITGGVRGSSGLLIVPLETDFQWTRASISLAVSVNLFAYGLMGPFAAALMETFGLTRTVLSALCCVGLGVLLTTQVQQPWQLVALWGVIVGAGTGVTANVLAATVAARWFEARRGLVTGLLAAAAAAGQLLFLPLLAEIANVAGWRWLCGMIALATVILIPLVAVLMRDRPQDIALAPYGAKPSVSSIVTRTDGNPMRVALQTLSCCARTRDFWLIAASIFICGASTQGLIGTHLIPACVDHGIPELAAAGLLGGMAIFNFVGATASGWLSDRFDPRLLLAFYYGTRGVSLIYLPYGFDSFYGLSTFAIFYGLDWIATIPATIRLSTASFGTERGTIAFGWIMTIHQFGGALAALVAGIARMDLGTYLQSFLFAGLMCFAAAILVAFIGRSPAEPLPAANYP
ncbi:MFS family permease [Bradyrhizobium sp. USDA 4461]